MGPVEKGNCHPLAVGGASVLLRAEKGLVTTSNHLNFAPWIDQRVIFQI
jgi:hypothetical protein